MTFCDCLKMLGCFRKHQNGLCIKVGVIFTICLILCVSCYFLEMNRVKFKGKKGGGEFEGSQKLLQLKWVHETTTTTTTSKPTSAALNLIVEGSGATADTVEDVQITSDELKVFASITPKNDKNNNNDNRINKSTSKEILKREQYLVGSIYSHVSSEENYSDEYNPNHDNDLLQAKSVGIQRKRNCSNDNCHDFPTKDEHLLESSNESTNSEDFAYDTPKKVQITLKEDFSSNLDSIENIFSNENSYNFDTFNSDEDISNEFVLTEQDNGDFLHVYNDRPTDNRFKNFNQQRNHHLSNFKDSFLHIDHDRLESSQPLPILTTLFEKITTTDMTPETTPTIPTPTTIRIRTNQMEKTHQHHTRHQHANPHHHTIYTPAQQHNTNFNKLFGSSNDYLFHMRNSFDKLFHKNNLKIKNFFEKSIKL